MKCQSSKVHGGGFVPTLFGVKEENLVVPLCTPTSNFFSIEKFALRFVEMCMTTRSIMIHQLISFIELIFFVFALAIHLIVLHCLL